MFIIQGAAKLSEARDNFQMNTLNVYMNQINFQQDGIFPDPQLA